MIYNDGVNKIPGLYNEQGKAVVEVHNPIPNYDFLNLNPNVRTSAMHDHFTFVEEILKKQLQ